MKIPLLVCFAFALTGAGHCADEGPAVPPAEQNGLAFRLSILKPYQVRWGLFKAQIVLKNVSTQPIRAVTRCGPYLATGFAV